MWSRITKSLLTSILCFVIHILRSKIGSYLRLAADLNTFNNIGVYVELSGA